MLASLLRFLKHSAIPTETTIAEATKATTGTVGKGSWHGTVSGFGEIEGSNVGEGNGAGIVSDCVLLQPLVDCKVSFDS